MRVCVCVCMCVRACKREKDGETAYIKGWQNSSFNYSAYHNIYAVTENTKMGYDNTYVNSKSNFIQNLDHFRGIS